MYTHLYLSKCLLSKGTRNHKSQHLFQYYLYPLVIREIRSVARIRLQFPLCTFILVIAVGLCVGSHDHACVSCHLEIMSVLWTVPLALVLLGSWLLGPWVSVQTNGSCCPPPRHLSGEDMSAVWWISQLYNGNSSSPQCVYMCGTCRCVYVHGTCMCMVHVW